MRSILLVSLAGLILAGCSRSVDASEPRPSKSPSGSAAEPGSAPNTSKSVSFKFATQTLTVPEGFIVEEVAGPPLVNRPISVAFDEAGRLYVTDSSGLSDRAPIQFEQKPHRVVRLEDANGDGRFEHSTIFAEKMMFPQGALFYEGSLYVGAPPHIWKLTDTNGEGVADERMAWYDGKTLTGCANDLHGPYLGLDGRIYWTKGAFAEQRHELANDQILVSRAAHILRSRPDGTEREIMLTGGMDNPVGVAFTMTGERILSGTFFQVGTPGKRDGLIHAVYGGVYGKDQAAIDGHIRTGDLMPIMTHMGAAAPCGSITYRSQTFGREYTNNAFVCYFNLRKISRHQLVADGATYKTIDTDFITSDSQDFHPTDVLEDADGSLLVVDTGGWYKVCCPTSQLAKPDVLGGIYRIRKTGAPAGDDARGLQLPWATAPVGELVKLLADERPYVYERAVHLLGKKGEAGVTALRDIGLKAASATARRNAVWALARIEGSGARAAVRQALHDQDRSVVQVALEVASLWRDKEAFERSVQLLAGTDLALVRLAAETLGRSADARAVAALLAATKHLRGTEYTSTGTPADPGERVLEHALIYALIEIAAREPVFAALKSSLDPRVRRVAMVALDQMKAGDLKPNDVLAWLDSDQRVLKQTAGWVVGNHADWGDALAEFFRARLAATSRTEAERAELETQLAGLAKSVAIQDLLAASARETTVAMETRLLALRAMASAGLKITPPSWLSDLAVLLNRSSEDPALTRQAVLTARALPVPRSGHGALATALAATGRNPRLPADVRLDALAAASPAALSPIEPDLFDFLQSHLDGKEPMLLRGAAATVLAKASLSPDQQLALADTLKRVGPLETPKLLPAFEKNPNDTLGMKVVASLRQSPGLAGVRAGNLKPLFARFSPAVQQEGERLIALVNADANRQNARVDELYAKLDGGDIRRGQAVFNSAKASCSLCHMVGYLGGRLGPDLTGIGKIRNERELLEAIVYPSATFVRGYEPFSVKTRAGVEHSGIMIKDTPEEVILATGPEAQQRITRGDIDDLQPGSVSPMPPGMDVILSNTELADLVAFLKSRQ